LVKLQEMSKRLSASLPFIVDFDVEAVTSGCGKLPISASRKIAHTIVKSSTSHQLLINFSSTSHPPSTTFHHAPVHHTGNRVSEPSIRPNNRLSHFLASRMAKQSLQRLKMGLRHRNLPTLRLRHHLQPIHHHLRTRLPDLRTHPIARNHLGIMHLDRRQRNIHHHRRHQAHRARDPVRPQCECVVELRLLAGENGHGLRYADRW
jgi:hypothetical protein